MSLKQVATPCAGCFSRLKTASNELKIDSMVFDIEKLTGVPLAGAREIEVAHILQVMIEDIGLGTIKAQVIKPLKGMKVACYSGCLLTRPRSITQFDDSEQPMALDNVLEALGAEPVKWSHKAECCGGGFAASETNIVVDLGGQVLEAARQAGADALVVACPMCQANLDTRQKAIEEERGVKYNLPIVYYTQLMGLAFGYPVNKLGFKRLLTSPSGLLSSKGLA
jgi:heterodisulfide reductase subunit B